METIAEIKECILGIHASIKIWVNLLHYTNIINLISII